MMLYTILLFLITTGSYGVHEIHVNCGRTEGIDTKI